MPRLNPFCKSFAIFASLSLFAPALAHADIFRWDNHQLITGTAGITPAPGINLSSLNLTKADFTSLDLTGANFTGATIKSAHFRDSNLRGAVGWVPNATVPKTNVIQPDGTIKGLHLTGEETLLISNGDPVHVISQATAARTTALELVLDDTWDHPITFGSKLKPSLKGFLELEFHQGVDTSLLVGHSFDLFDWPKAIPTKRQFLSVGSQAGLTWDISQLYTTGVVTLTGAPPSGGSSTPSAEVPEPASLAVFGLGGIALLIRRKRA